MADDTTIFLKNHKYIPVLLEILEKFSHCSGLCVNVEKTKAFSIGNNTFQNTYGLDWSNDHIELLGITITNDEAINCCKCLGQIAFFVV